MSYLILIFAFLAIAHYVHEGLIAPNERARLRIKLFILKNRLDALRKEQGKGPHAKDIHLVRDGVIDLIQEMDRYELVSYIRTMSAIRRDKKLRESASQRIRALDESTNAELRDIWNESSVIAFRVVQVNAGAWAFYVVPVIALIASLKKLRNGAKALLTIPEPLLERLMKHHGPASHLV